MDPQPVNGTWRIVFASVGLAFDAAVIWWTLLCGNPANSLHASAQSWAWFMGFTTMAGIGVSSLSKPLVDLVTWLTTKKP